MIFIKTIYTDSIVIMCLIPTLGWWARPSVRADLVALEQTLGHESMCASSVPHKNYPYYINIIVLYIVILL